MIKNIIDENALLHSNSKQLSALHRYFEGCFTADGKFDLECFKEKIREDVTITEEGYGLNFLGKDYSNLIASIDTTTVIEPDIEHNNLLDNKDSENIYISGDNLDALKHLLRSYESKVKCIYIDPPYNTGSDGFVYNDNFNFSSEQLQKRLGIDENEADRLMSMTSKGSSSHSAWLMFMSPRLQLARDLLAKDGVIFISIDDNEQADLKLLCDYVFGEEDFEGCIHYRRRSNQPNDKTKLIGLVAEHILVYSKNKAYLKEVGVGKISLTGDFSNPDNDSRGPWASKPWKTGSDQSGSRYIIKTPTGQVLDEEWMGDETTYKKLLLDNRIYFPKKGEGAPRKKYFKYEREAEGQCASNWWNWDTYGDNASANKVLTEMFGFKNAFSNPKSPQLLDAIIGLSNLKEGDIVLDFFGGSATTAHAALKYSVDCPIKFILVQLPENLDSLYEKTTLKSDKDHWKEIIDFLDKNHHPHTLDYIGYERIRRAAKRIHDENPLFTGDLGFKHYTLREVPENVLEKLEDFNPEETNFANNIMEMFGRDTVLATWMERDGCGLNAKYDEVKLEDYTAYQCGDYLYLLDEGMSHEAITALIDKYGDDTDWGPHYLVVFGYSFNFGELDSIKKNVTVLQVGEKQIKVNIEVRY